MSKPAAVWCCIGTAFTLWSLWCVLMASYGEPFSNPAIRALVRIAVIAIPAVLFLSVYPNDSADRFALRNAAKRGITVGFVVAAIQLLFLALSRTLNLDLLPTTAAAWCNYIIISPIAEELLFRRVAVDQFCERYGISLGLFLSAVLFSLIHLPWWLMSGEHTGLQLASMLVTLAIYGLVFGLLYRTTCSLWASLIPHWSNNLAATVFV